MFKKYIQLLILVFCILSPANVFAQYNDIYKYYMRLGHQALEKKQFSEAYDYFNHAYLTNSESQEARFYLQKLQELNARRQEKNRQEYQTSSEGYPSIFSDYMRWGKKALKNDDYKGALELFEYASVVDPSSDEPLFYINLIKRLKEKKVQRVKAIPEIPPEKKEFHPIESKIPVVKKDRSRIINETLDHYETVISGHEIISEISQIIEEASLPKTIETVGQVASKTAVFRKSTKEDKVLTKTFTQIKYSDVLKGERELYLNDELRAQGSSATVRIELNSALIVKGRNIDRHLIITPGIIEIEKVDRDQIKIKAIKRGTTILHIWDDQGRSTFNTEVILPLITADAVVEEKKPVEYAEPFKFSYSADWNSFYLGQSLPEVKRANLTFLQRYAIYGETPYGEADAFGVYNKVLKTNELTRYGVGLTDGQIGDFKDFTIRGYDISKEFSPLTLPSQFYRGLLFESDAFDHNIHYAYVRGKSRSSFGFAPVGTTDLREAYLEGVRMTLFPEEENNYSFNFARGFGDERQDFLKEKVYSVELNQRLNPLLISTESAFDEEDFAHTVKTKFGDEKFKGAVNLRDIDKGFTTISDLPSNQGEIGGNILLDWNLEPMDISTFLDVYQERLFTSPDNGDQLNFDFNTSVSVPFSLTDQWRTSFFYLNTPGELSPRENLRAFTNYTKRFSITQDKDLTTTFGGGYQKSRFKLASLSEYDRYSLNVGLRYPILKDLSYFANYEFSWVDELSTGDRLYPSVFTTGLNYFHQINDKLTGNLGYSYRDEENTEGINSFLAGEDSTTGTIGLNYAPKNDVEIFMDGRVRNVWKEQESKSAFNEVDVRVGLRSLWDLPFAWSPAGSVEGNVFKDLNNNKIKDPNEAGIKDVRIHVGEQEAYTDSLGYYKVDVRAKKVFVNVDSNSIPQGFIFSTPTFVEADISLNKKQQIDFGLTTQSGIYGIVYFDENQNGKPEGQDKFIPRAKIILDGKKEVQSDFEGTYLFQDVGEGKHIVTIDVNSLPIEYLPAIKLKNEIEVTEGVTYVFHIPLNKNQIPSQE